MTYRCIGGFAVYVDGQPRVVAGGSLVADDDPILKTNPSAFERVETYTARQAAAPRSFSATETATAAPGELRATTVTKPPSTTTTTRKGDEK